MDAKIGQFFDSVGSFFSGSDKIPWCDGDVIAVSFFLYILHLFRFFSAYVSQDEKPSLVAERNHQLVAEI